MPHSSSIAPDEIARFSSHAGDWWNPDGAFRPLHRLNPLRLEYIIGQARAHCGGVKGRDLLDVGCGGGLLTEPLARLGARVTGLDAAKEAIATARRHASEMDLTIDYCTGSVEELARRKKRYAIITALEIAEHVADLASFLRALSGLLKPGGLLILSTLNRTPKSFLLGIVAAEYVLRWVPRGTHQWQKFIRPSELVCRLEEVELETTDLTGVVFNPLNGEFELSRDDLAVNYILTATRR